MLITRTSRVSGIKHTREIHVTQEQLDAWRNTGRPIQFALPHISAADREFILSGITPEEWDALFEGDE